MAEPARAPRKDLDESARVHQTPPAQPIHGGVGAQPEQPTWFEVADAIWLTSFRNPQGVPDPSNAGQVPETKKPASSGPPPGDEKDHPPPEMDPRTPHEPEADSTTKRAGTRKLRAEPVVTAFSERDAVVGSAYSIAGMHVPPLPGAVDIVRALRPLHRKVFSHRDDDVVLDEEATAERAVQDGLWLPVTRAAKERWLDLTLVVDSGPSMALWRPTVEAFETLLGQLGTFRRIQRRMLDTSRSNSVAPTLRGGTPAAPARSLAQVLDPSGRRVVLVLTDGVSGNWRSPALSAMLARLARSMPTALVHLLPQRLWRQTGLNLHRARLKPHGRLAPNSRWSMALPDAWLEPEPVAATPVHHGAVPVPVLELDAPWFRLLAQLLMGDSDPDDATVVLAHESAGNESNKAEDSSGLVSAHDQVKSFLSTASPTAFHLATLMAAVPVSLQTARLIQSEVVPDAGTEHIAEVLGSSLFEPEPRAYVDSPWDMITFNVRPEVRKELLSSARRSETARVVRMAACFGSHSDMARTWAALDSPDSTPDPGPLHATPSEITIERIVMEALSGPYLSRAGRLAELEERTDSSGATTTSSDTVSNDMSDAVEPAGLLTDPSDHLSGPVTVTEASPAETAHPTDSGLGNAPGHLRPDSPLLMPDLGIERQPSESPRIWGNVPPRNLNFTGRVDLLNSLGERLRTGTTAVLPSALHGMGGIGKTQTAVEYIYRHLREYDVVWWIEASHATQIRASLTELAQALGLPGGAEANTAVHAVREALRRGQPYRRWLLVFDAAADPEIVRPFFPTDGPGQILITARNPSWASVTRPLEVATFDRSESVELLLRRGPDIDGEDADRLAETLGDLPLAIEQAAAWRAETGMPIVEYLRLFDEKRVEILDTSAPADYEVPVAAAWNVSFDELRKRSPAAHQLLQICAFFSPEPISRHLFAGVRNISITPELDRALRDPMQLSRAIRDINRYGLAKIDHRNNTLQLHRLVQMVLRNRMGGRQQEEMRHGAHLLLANYDPKDPLSPEQWQRYQDVLPHVYAANLIECDDPWGRELVVNLMTFLYRWGDHDEAISLAERTLAQWQVSPGEEDSQTLQVAGKLGYYYWIMGDYSQAAELNLRTLDIRRRVDGENNEDTLLLQIAVAGDLRARGDFTGASRLSSEVYQRATALFGDDDPTTLRFARTHGISLRLDGKYREAAILDADTYQRLLNVLGNDHPETLSTLSGLIMDRREAGEYVWARDEQEKLVIRAKEMHGENSADTLRRRAYLAVARRKAGDHEGALELSTEVLGRFQVRYGRGNFNAMACALGRSIDLRHTGDLRLAKEAGEDILERYRVNMGEDHPYTSCAAVDLAVTLRLLGDPTTARQLNESALEKLRSALGPDHVHAILCSINLASDLAALGDAGAALALTTDAVERSERVLGVDHPTTLAASLNLALDLLSLGREQDAQKRNADVLSRYRKVLGAKHRATNNAVNGIRADCDIDPLPL